MYGELIIGLNMVFNFAILSFANKMQNVRIGLGRLSLASFVGAIPVVFFPVSLWTILIAFLGMTVVAFGKAFDPWKKSASMVLIGALFAGGLLTALQYNVRSFGGYQVVFIYAIIAYIALYFIKRKWLDVRTSHQVSELYANSTLHLWNRKIPVKVFVDSGNSCTEPLSGNPVHFICLRAVADFIPESLKESLLSWESQGPSTLADFPEDFRKDLRLVRLLTVQGESWAIGIKYKNWFIEGGEQLDTGYIVITKGDSRYPAGAHAILHVSAMEKINGERGKEHAKRN